MDVNIIREEASAHGSNRESDIPGQSKEAQIATSLVCWRQVGNVSRGGWRGDQLSEGHHDHSQQKAPKTSTDRHQEHGCRVERSADWHDFGRRMFLSDPRDRYLQEDDHQGIGGRDPGIL